MKYEFKGIICAVVVTALAAILLFFPEEAYAYSTNSIGPKPQIFQQNEEVTELPSWYRSIYGASIFAGDLVGDGSQFIGFTTDNHPGINLLKSTGTTWEIAKSTGTVVDPLYKATFEPTMRGTTAALANFSGTAQRDLILGARVETVAEEIRFDGKRRSATASGIAWFRYSVTDGFVKQQGFYPFGKTYTGGLNVGAGDVNGDGIDEIFVAKTVGNRPDVSIFTSDGTLLYSFSVYEETFRGGVNIDSVDFDGDGRDEVVVVPQSAREAEVRVINPSNGAVLHSFVVFPGLKSGASLSVHQATQHIVVGTSAGLTPMLQEYDLHSSVLDGINAKPFQSGFRAGVEVVYLPKDTREVVVTHGAKYLVGTQLTSYDWWFDTTPKGRLRKDGTPIPALFASDGAVLAEYGAVPPGASIAAADIDGDGSDEIAFGSPPGHAPKVWLYHTNGKLIQSFPVFDAKLRTGITVALLPKTNIADARIVVTPGNGAQSVVRFYSLNGSYTGESFQVHASSYKKGIMIIVGHFQNANEYQLITLPRGANLPMKIFSRAGRLLHQRSITSPQQTNVPYTSSLAVLPDANGDGLDDVVHFSGPPNSIVFYSSYSGRTLDTLWDYQNAENWVVENPPIQTPIRMGDASKNFGQITTRFVEGRTKMAFGLAGNMGPVVVVTGAREADRNIITTYPSTWKGTVTPVSIPHGYRGADAYVVVGGRPIDSVTWTKDVNFLKPSVVPAGQMTVVKSLSGTVPHGSYSAKIVIANLRHSKLQVRSVKPNCAGKCAASMTSYVKFVNGFAGINATGPYPYQLRSNPYDPKTAGRLLGYMQFNYGSITFSNTNEWYTSIADTLLRDDYKSIRSSFFTLQTGQKAISGWSLGAGGRSPGSLIGVRGSDLYFVTYSTRGGANADREFINSLNFIYSGENDGGGAIALYHRGKFIAGPGRNITGALVLTQK